MLAILKRAILKKYMDLRLRWFKEDGPAVELPSAIRDIHNILIISPGSKEMEEDVHFFASELSREFDPVKVSTFERNSFRPQDGNWFGLPVDAYLENFRQEHFDMVIDLNPEQDRLCTYICALSGGTLRINLASGAYDHIYNFHIRMDKIQPLRKRLQGIIENLKRFKTIMS